MSGDRFIPSRSAMNMNLYHGWCFDGVKEAMTSDFPPGKLGIYRSALAEACSLRTGRAVNNLFAFYVGKPSRGHTSGGSSTSVRRPAPPQVPVTERFQEKRFPAAHDCTVVFDRYVNVLDWGPDDVIAMGLGRHVHLFDPEEEMRAVLTTGAELEGLVTSVAWSPDGDHLAIGLQNSEVQIWELQSAKMIRKFKEHQGGRIGSLSWNGIVLTAGMADGTVQAFDVSAASPTAYTCMKAGNQGEICSLKWSYCGCKLASGSRNGQLRIWDMGSSREMFSFQDEEKATIKALDWNPVQSYLLAFGTGCRISIWNTSCGLRAKMSKPADSQLSGLVWSPDAKELLTSHFSSPPTHQLNVWKYPCLHIAQEASVLSIRSPVFYMVSSVDGHRVATIEANNTLRFWKVFENHGIIKQQNDENVAENILSFPGSHIRWLCPMSLLQYTGHLLP